MKTSLSKTKKPSADSDDAALPAARTSRNGRYRTTSAWTTAQIPAITTMYAKPSASQNFSTVCGAWVKLPMSSPRSEITSRTPLGTAMNRIPTTAKLAASKRRFRTTNRSALAPVMRGRDPTPPLPRIRAMIDRDQVLHVARLARLELTEDELKRMAGELSGILEHVE